ncbi:MAG: hypothetical protein AB7S65_08165 [Sulfuricurvum sp.]
MELITATECVNRLRQAGVFKGKLPYFIHLVNSGWIPHHEKSGSSKRWYVYEEAKTAIKESEDPRRDSQREANEAKRNSEPIKDDQTPKLIEAILTRMDKLEVLSPEMFDRSKLDSTDAETFDCEIHAINVTNQVISEMTFELLALLNKLSGGNFRSSKAELRVSEFLKRWIVKPDTVRELYAID